eukprot:m.127647 g.127647  ORF g.127647 m.127647 type:complete len:928 (+) comp37932_c0_seq24:2642-5425(+)
MMKEIEDLDQLQTPESLLLSFVSGEDTQDRTDRVMLTPWVKTLWEAYRNVLDLLRNNNKLEKVYHETAQSAFRFCLEYSRKTEFRKLCENMRTHLQHVIKHSGGVNTINLNSPESLQMHVETRLMQLDTAIETELWQEAFRTIEDIHNLLTMSKKLPKPAVVANYYTKQARVYQMAGNKLFHACACHRLFVLSKEQKKNLQPEEQQSLASHAVLATLHVPIPQSKTDVELYLDDDVKQDKKRRLASLLGLQIPPTRKSLLSDLLRYNMFQYAIPECRELYHWLEEEFNPLQLCQHVETIFAGLREHPEYGQYVESLEDVAIVRLVKQVAQVYETIELDRLARLVPFAEGFRLERALVHVKKNLNVQVRLDHCSRSLRFGSDLSMVQKNVVLEGPQVQTMPSDVIQTQLVEISKALQQAVKIVDPKLHQNLRDKERAASVEAYKRTASRDHRQTLGRKLLIEQKLELIEHLNTERERKAKELAEELRLEALKKENERLKLENMEKEKEKKRRELEEIARQVTMNKIEEIKKTAVGVKALADLKPEELEGLDPDDLVAKQMKQLEVEKNQLQTRLTSQSKKVDHFERAKRIVEIPKLVEQFEQKKVDDEEFHYNEETKRIENAERERKIAVETQNRLTKMKDDAAEFMSVVMATRKKEFKEHEEEFRRNVAEEKARRLEERRLRRIEKRREDYYREKEEAKEEAERAALEAENEKRREEEAEKRQKFEEIERRQREREREIEERERLRRQEEQQRAEDRSHWERNEREQRSSETSDWRRKPEERREIERPREIHAAPTGRYVPPARRAIGRPETRPDEGGAWERGRVSDDRDRGRDPRPREDPWRRGPPRGSSPPSLRDDRFPARRGESPPRWERQSSRDLPARDIPGRRGESSPRWERQPSRDLRGRSPPRRSGPNVDEEGYEFVRRK